MNFTTQNTLKDRSFSWEHIPPKFVSPNKQLFIKKNMQKCTLRPQTGHPTQKQRDQMLLSSSSSVINLPDRDFLVQNSKHYQYDQQNSLDQQILYLVKLQQNLISDQNLNSQNNIDFKNLEYDTLQYINLLRFKNSFRKKKSQSTEPIRKTVWYKTPLYEENPNPPNKKGIIPEEGINNKNLELYYKLNYEMSFQEQKDQYYQNLEDNDQNLSFRENVQGKKFTWTKQQYDQYIFQKNLEIQLKKQEKQKQLQLQQLQQQQQQLLQQNAQNNGTDPINTQVLLDNQDEIFNFLNEYEQRNNLNEKYDNYMVQQIENQQHFIINEQEEEEQLQEQDQNTFNISSCKDRTNIDLGFGEKKKLIDQQNKQITIQSNKDRHLAKIQKNQKTYEKQKEKEKLNPEQINQQLIKNIEKLAKTRKKPEKLKNGQIKHHPKIGHEKFGIQKNYDYEDIKKQKQFSQNVQNLLNQIQTEFYIPGNAGLSHDQAFDEVKSYNSFAQNQKVQTKTQHKKQISITQQEKIEKYNNFITNVESGELQKEKTKKNIIYDDLKMEYPKYLKEYLKEKQQKNKHNENQINIKQKKQINKLESSEIPNDNISNRSKINDSQNSISKSNISSQNQNKSVNINNSNSKNSQKLQKPKVLISQTANVMDTYLTELNNEMGDFEFQEVQLNTNVQQNGNTSEEDESDDY